jgi:hypothetical protein
MRQGPLGSFTNPPLIDRHTGGLNQNLAPEPACALNPTPAQLDQCAAQVMRGLVQINSSVDTRSLIGHLLGQQSFTYGVVVGLVESLGKSIYALADLLRILALAEVYEMQHVQPHRWSRLLRRAALIAMPGVVTANAAIGMIPGIDRFTKEAYETRQGLIKVVQYAFDHPGEVWGKLKEEYKGKYQEFKKQEAKHTLVGNFNAGRLFGELVLEVLMVLDGATTLFKIAQKGTQLLKLLTDLKGLAPKLREAAAAGKTAVKAEAPAPMGAAEAGVAGRADARVAEEAAGEKPGPAPVEKPPLKATARRVKLRKATVEKIRAKQPRNADGEMVDHKGELLKEDEIDIGHKPGQEWRKRKKMHEERGSTRKEVIEAENDPDLYHLEDRGDNRSHKYEEK